MPTGIRDTGFVSDPPPAEQTNGGWSSRVFNEAAAMAVVTEALYY